MTELSFAAPLGWAKGVIVNFSNILLGYLKFLSIWSKKLLIILKHCFCYTKNNLAP